MENESLEIVDGQNDKLLTKELDMLQYNQNDKSEDKPQEDGLDESLDRHLAAMEQRRDDSFKATVEDKPRTGRGNRATENPQEEEKPARGRGTRAENTKTKEELIQPRGRGNRNPAPQQAKEVDSSAWDDSKQEEVKHQNFKNQDKNLDKSSWDDQDNQTGEKKEPANQETPVGRMGRTPAPKAEEKASKLDESAWDSDDNKEEKPKESVGRGNGRGKPSKDDEDKELEPDKLEKSNWDEQKEEEKPKNEEPEMNRGRGNRGNRGNRDDDKTEENNTGFAGQGRRNRDRDFGNNSGGGYPSKSYGQNYGRGDRGGRGSLRGGRGGSFGEFRSNRENDGFRGNRQGGGFRGNREERSQPFNRNRYDAEGNNDRPFFKKQGGFNNNKDFNNNGDNFRGVNPEQSSNSNSNLVQNSAIKSQSPVFQAVPLIEPKGLESWPQVSLYAKKCKVSLTLRSINQHQADGIVFPVEDMNFKLYPSVLINADQKYNYRQKIQEKFDTDYWAKCPVYRKSCHGMGYFKDVFFCKVDTLKEPDYREMVTTLLRFGMMEPKSESLVFPICKELRDFKSLLETLMSGLITLSDHKKCFVKRIEFTTKDTEWFRDCAAVFLTKIREDIEANKIYIS